MSESAEKILSNGYENSGAESWARPDISLVVCDEPPAPTFPAGLLGEEWASWVAANASSANAPVDYVGASLITTAAALIGNARTVHFGSWRQPATVWTVLLGPPSAKKSPAMRPLKEAVGILEAELADDGSDTIPQIRISDVTAAAAAEVSASNNNGLLLQRDELSGFWEQTARTGGEGFWLESYDGGSYAVNRKGQPALHIPRLNISILGTAQPDPVRALLEAKVDRGFVARHLYVYPMPTHGFKRPQHIDQSKAHDALRRLRDLRFRSEAEGECHLTADAEQVADTWLSKQQEKAEQSEGAWAQWLGKQNGMLLRYALIFQHLWWCGSESDSPPSEVGALAVEAAAAFIDDYAAPMAARTFNLAARGSVRQAGVISAPSTV
jgi:hypothetical protein